MTVMADPDALGIDQALQTQTSSVPYTIHSYSSFSGNFRPSNIIVDRPKDSTSRWSCGTVVTNAMAAGSGRDAGSQAQPWIMLELRTPAVVSYMTFGKHVESHPCNPQFVTVLAGPDPKHLQQILHDRLRNDAVPERKSVVYRAGMTPVETERLGIWEANARRSSGGNIPFAVRFVKILPGPAYEARFNPSLWHVDLQGVTAEHVVAKVEARYRQAQALHANRVVLKYLRAQQIRPAYDALLDHMRATSGSPPPLLEHPLLTDLHQAIVEEGDYDRAEVLIHTIMEQGLMDDYIARMPVTHTWHQLQPALDADGSPLEPSRRGGHAMCRCEGEDGAVYLFGGWDGAKDLDDFWIREQADFDMDDEAGGLPTYRWRRVQRKEGQVWPSARSGHAMTVHDRQIFMMGSVENTLRVLGPAMMRSIGGKTPDKAETPPSESFGLVSADLADVVARGMPVQDKREAEELWVYDLDEGQWSVLETAQEDGDDHPKALEVKDMKVIDGVLYVYGAEGNETSARSRIFKLDLVTSHWSRMSALPIPNSDLNGFGSPQTATFDARTKSLIVVEAGPASSRQTTMLWRVDLSTDRLVKLENFGQPLPALKAGQPVRAVYDEQNADVIFVIGHAKSCILPKSGRLAIIGRYNIPLAEWLVMPEAGGQTNANNAGASVDFDADRAEPSSRKEYTTSAIFQRCGHQLLHEPSLDACYIMGSSTPAAGKRGNDACALTFSRSGRASVKRKCLLALRKQKFIDMVSTAPSVQALHYLQGPLHAVVDHDNPDESRHFRGLLAHLLQFGTSSDTVVIDASGNNSASPEHHYQRLGVFDAIMSFIAARYKQPAKDLLHISQDTV